MGEAVRSGAAARSAASPAGAGQSGSEPVGTKSAAHCFPESEILIPAGWNGRKKGEGGQIDQGRTGGRWQPKHFGSLRYGLGTTHPLPKVSETDVLGKKRQEPTTIRVHKKRKTGQLRRRLQESQTRGKGSPVVPSDLINLELFR